MYLRGGGSPGLSYLRSVPTKKTISSSTPGSAAVSGVRSTLLPNGVAVVTERMEGLRSQSVGVWLGLGSRHDPVGKAGLAHLYEHMVFKGTGRRSALRVSRELEEVGGHLNAFTSREQTCFYAKVLDRDQDRAVDLVCDLVTGAKLGKKDLELERQVVLEEIRGCDDDPEELVGELFANALWNRQALGEPIAGTLDSVSKLSVDDLLEHRRRSLSGDVPLLVTASGNVDHDRLVSTAAKALESRAFGERILQKVERVGARQVSRIVVEKDVSQVNLILSRRSPGAHHPDRHAVSLVNLILGGGMSSRLNQEIREKRGLAYSVYSFADFLLGTGALGVSLGTEPAQAAKAVKVVGEEIRKLREEGVSKKELRFAKDHAAGAAVLALESSSARMQHLGKCLLLYGRTIALEEIMDNIESVQPEHVQRVLHEQFPDVREENGWTLSAVVPQGFRGNLLD